MIDTDLEQAQAKLDFLKAAAGMFEEDFIEAQARKIITDTLTPPAPEPEPELEPSEEERCTLTTADFLATKELPHWWAAGCSRGFGRSVRTAFLERTGKSPRHLSTSDKSTCIYPESARTIMEEIYDSKIYGHIEVIA